MSDKITVDQEERVELVLEQADLTLERLEEVKENLENVPGETVEALEFPLEYLEADITHRIDKRADEIGVELQYLREAIRGMGEQMHALQVVVAELLRRTNP